MDNGGCMVKYIGRPRPGKTTGTCFSESFRGGCSGTPPECENCNEEVSCSENGRPQNNNEGIP